VDAFLREGPDAPVHLEQDLERDVAEVVHRRADTRGARGPAIS
jgi:hypothetical protein